MKVRSISASISVTITYIWTKFGTELKYHTINTPEWWNLHSLKIQHGGRRHLGFLGYVKRKNVNKSGLDKVICIKFYGIMHWTLAYTTTEITACTVVQAVLTVWMVVSCSNNFSTKLGSGWLGYGNTSKIMRTTYHVPRTMYPEQRNSYGNLIKLQI